MTILMQYKDECYDISYCFRFTDGQSSFLNNFNQGRLERYHIIITEIV